MTQSQEQHSLIERCLSVFTRLRPGEGRSLVIFTLYGFLLMVSYYVLKTIREALILVKFSAEVRSYAVGTIALLLLFLIPVYGVIFRHTSKITLVRWITAFFAANLVVFWLMARSGMEIGFIYFVWVGIFGVMMVAQFWAFATDSYNVKAGQRLFPFIMVGAAAGALGGSQLARLLTGTLGMSAADVLLVGAILLAATLLFGGLARNAIPENSRAVDETDESGESTDDKLENMLGGFALVARHRYLTYIALLVILLNWVNTTGETILADFVKTEAQSRASGGGATESQFISSFYGNFYFWVNLLGFVLQAFLVARIYRWIGVAGALLILPVIAAVGYGVMAFVPIFSIIQLVKILENSTDYSVMNTTRQVLYLPLDRAQKYEGKTAVDTFFWRLGDLIQAGAFYIGLNWFQLSIPQFAIVNFVLALAWIWLAWKIGQRYRSLVKSSGYNTPPVLTQAIPDVVAPPGHAFEHSLAVDTFIDRDPGDMLTLSATLASGEPLPQWLSFSPKAATFQGRVPGGIDRRHTEVKVKATDLDGSEASGNFRVVHRPEGEGA
ncbi:MAG: Npt1/Npt2 family nucleotide transporter [Gammaproteobacteria bacterium]